MDDSPVPFVCPLDRGELVLDRDDLVCAEGHRFPLVDGIPILLVEEEEPTHAVCGAPPTKLETPATSSGGAVDPFVAAGLAATCGRLYRHLNGRLSSYPIPELRRPRGNGELLLEVGCGWGRWCIAAARKGYTPVGMDPSLEAIRAARRVAGELGVRATYVVADARHLPFRDRSFGVVLSYSVFQHFAKADALGSFDEVARVLASPGVALVQIANVYGLHNLWNQARERRFREQRTLFDVRYWSLGELHDELSRRVGPTEVFADGFFTLNPQPTDLALLPRRYRAVVLASEALRRASDRLRLLRYAADSLYAVSRR